MRDKKQQLTGAIFLTSFASSCASYWAAGRVAFSVGLRICTSFHSVQKAFQLQYVQQAASFAPSLASSLDFIFYGLLILALIDSLLHEKQDGRPYAYRGNKGKPYMRQLKVLTEFVVGQHRHCMAKLRSCHAIHTTHCDTKHWEGVPYPAQQACSSSWLQTLLCQMGLSKHVKQQIYTKCIDKKRASARTEAEEREVLPESCASCALLMEGLCKKQSSVNFTRLGLIHRGSWLSFHAISARYKLLWSLRRSASRHSSSTNINRSLTSVPRPRASDDHCLQSF